MKEEQDDDADMFYKDERIDLVRTNGKNSLDSCRMKNFIDYNSQNGFKFYVCG